jgi:sugar phosphate permease
MMGRPRLSPPGVILALLCAMYFLLFVNRTNIALAGPLMARELHFDNTDLGLAFAAFGYPYALFQLLGGTIGDYFGPRKTLAVSLLLVFAATLWTGAVGGLTTLVLARLALGFGEGCAFPTATRAMSAWTARGRWGFAQGLTHTFSRVGNASTALIVPGLIALVTWRGSFYWLAPVNLVWALAWFWYFRDDPHTHPATNDAMLARLPERHHGPKRTIPWFKLARWIAPVTAVDFCYGWFLVLFQTWIPSYFVQNYHLNLKGTALYTAGVLFAGVIGDTLGGTLSDIILHRTGNLVLARRAVIILGFAGAATCMVPVVLAFNLTVSTLCLSLAFFFNELIVGPIWAVPMDIAPRYAGTASGMMNFGFGLASILAPMFFGRVIDLTGGWTVPWTVTIGLLVLGAVLASYLRPDQPFRQAETVPAVAE